MLGLWLKMDATSCDVKVMTPSVEARLVSLAMVFTRRCFGIKVKRQEHGCSIECFVTVSGDYGYGFTLYDPYGIGERRIR